ncbi:polyadenylation and cleavage factor homolog 4 [Euphorbia lathyris]|uniref:polyadenylation and cleavage factor homolog 4 n=1 Tax=Euphorbia lathyris TaxID=212925 RepID=UPI00331448AC
MVAIKNPNSITTLSWYTTMTTTSVKHLPSNEKAPPSLLDRFRVILKQREEEVRDGDEDVASEEMVQLYELLLDELTLNSKPIITDLTIIAGELREHGEGIADAICARIVEAPVEHKLPSLYLLDSIVKNIGREYARYFSSRLPEVFCLAYKQVHPNLYPSMRHLFGTWSSVFPRSVLGKIEAELQFSSQVSSQPPGLPSLKESDSPRPAHGIHVNPKYVRQLEQSTSDNNAQHVRGASPTLKMFSQKPAVGYDEYDSDQADITSTQAGAQRLNALGRVGNTSYALGANKLHQSSSSRLARHLSPSTVGAERPLISEVDDFATGNSPRRFVDGTSPSHPAFDYGPVRSVGRDEEINEWRRKHYPDDNHKRFEPSIAYSLPNGHGRQGPRALIDAYGEDERNKIPNNKSLIVDRLDSDGLVNKVAPMSWQNTEEEEFDWEDMSPTLADRSRGNNFLTAPVPPFRGARVRPGFVTRDVSRLEADGRISQSGQAQLSLMDDSSNITEDASARGSTGKIPGFQSERNQITGSHYPREAWKLPHNFPHLTERSREFPLPFSRSGVSSSGSESLAPLVDKLPEMDGQLVRAPNHPLRISSSLTPSSVGAWPIVNVHKSHPPPTHPIFPPQKQSRTQYDPRNASNPAGNQGSQKSSFLSDQQLNSLESKESSLMKPSFLHGQLAGMNQQNHAQVHPFHPQFLPSNGARENFSSPMPPHPLLPPFDHGYGIQGHGMGMGMVPSNPMHAVRHPLPFNFPNSFHSQGGMRPPLPSGPHPASQVIPIHQNSGPMASNQPGNAFSGLIGSLMAQGLISLTNEAPSQDSLGLDFNNADLLKVRHESAITALYADLPRQCTTCGLRFKSQEEHSSHMDWHVTKNRMSKNRKQKPSRKWFVTASMWLSGAEALGADAVPGFLPAESVVEKKDDEEMAVPADEDQNACALCGEPFDDFYSDETEEWMYKGAVYLNVPDGLTEGMDRSQLGPIVHAKCRSESSTVPHDDFRNEGDNAEESPRKRMRS